MVLFDLLWTKKTSANKGGSGDTRSTQPQTRKNKTAQMMMNIMKISKASSDILVAHKDRSHKSDPEWIDSGSACHTIRYSPSTEGS